MKVDLWGVIHDILRVFTRFTKQHNHNSPYLSDGAWIIYHIPFLTCDDSYSHPTTCDWVAHMTEALAAN